MRDRILGTKKEVWNFLFEGIAGTGISKVEICEVIPTSLKPGSVLRRDLIPPNIICFPFPQSEIASTLPGTGNPG